MTCRMDADDAGGEEEYVMPSVEALIAGTMALMTAYAQAAPECGHRSLLARKLLSNLFFLGEHPQLSLPMRQMLANLRERWQKEARQSLSQPPLPHTTPLWHPVPERVQ